MHYDVNRTKLYLGLNTVLEDVVGMPLGIAPLGKEMRVVNIVVEDKLRKHFENLGLLKGGSVTPISNNTGDIIVKIRNSRVAINRGIAMKIFVE